MLWYHMIEIKWAGRKKDRKVTLIATNEQKKSPNQNKIQNRVFKKNLRSKLWLMLEPPLGLTYYPPDSKPGFGTRWMKETGREEKNWKKWIRSLIFWKTKYKNTAQCCFKKIMSSHFLEALRAQFIENLHARLHLHGRTTH